MEAEDIYTEGITSITTVDMKYASKMGMTIKFFGTSRRMAKRSPYFCNGSTCFGKPDTSSLSV